MGSLSCVLPNKAYVYTVLLIYSSSPIIFGQPSFWSIQCMEEVFLQSRYQVFRDGQRRDIIDNILRLHHLYVSTSYNWIWYFQQSQGALALQLSPELQGIIGNTNILYIIIIRPL